MNMPSDGEGGGQALDMKSGLASELRNGGRLTEKYGT